VSGWDWSTVLDVLAGAALLAASVAVLVRRPRNRCGALLALAGALWLAASAAPGAFLLTAHRGPLVHAALAYPDGRVRGRAAQLAVAVAWVTALVPPLAGAPAATIAVAAMVGVAAIIGAMRARGPSRSRRRTGAAVAAAVTAVPAIGAALHLAGVHAESPVVAIYDAVVFASAVALAAGLQRREVERLVLELAASPGGHTLRQSLRAALGDPGLRVAYRLPGGELVDEGGNPANLEPGNGRVLTRLYHAGEPVGGIVHDPAVLDEPELVEAVAAMARVAVENARLRAHVRTQIAELSASRARLVEAAQAERRRLAAELERGALGELDAVARALAGADGAADARAHLTAARADMLRLADGLRPAALAGGLRSALEAGVRTLPLPAQLELANVELAADVETALGYVAAEGLANMAKHARAEHVTMRLACDDGEVVLEIADDGIGGADADGSGLHGVTKRIEALGGHLELRSNGGGTRLRASIPVARPRDPDLTDLAQAAASSGHEPVSTFARPATAEPDPRVRAGALVGGFVAAGVALAVARSQPLFSPAGPSVGLETLGLGAGLALITAASLAPVPSRAARSLLVGAGFAWLLAAWGGPSAGTALLATAALFAAGLAAPLAADGALRGRDGRRPSAQISYAITALLAAGLLGGVVVALFTQPAAEGCTDCSRNLLAVTPDAGAADAIARTAAWAAVAGAVALIVLLAARILAGTGPERRRLAAETIAVAMLVAAAGAAALDRALNGVLIADPLSRSLWLAQAAGLAAVASAVAWRQRVHRRSREALAAVTARAATVPTPGSLRAELADALGDQSLDLAYRIAGSDDLVDADGRPTELAADSARERTVLTLEGRQLAVLTHRPGLFEDSDLIDALASAGGLALEHERLAAELAVRLSEVRASRARVVAAGDAERRRLERDLHDGAQQRLAALALTLQLVHGSTREVSEAQAHLHAALEALRALARGIFPRALVGDGLGAALEELAEEAARPVRLRHASTRAPEVVEATAYLVAAAAVAVGHEPLTLDTAGGSARLQLMVEGAAAAPSPDLCERVDALGGTLAWEGDMLRLELPCAW
jgi:signal transduction histidine kinase